jgi:hypothetical protein
MDINQWSVFVARPTLGTQFGQHRHPVLCALVWRLRELRGEDWLGRIDPGVHEVDKRSSQLLGPGVECELHQHLASNAARPTGSGRSRDQPLDILARRVA